MEKMSCSVYVIIVTFNAMKWIDKCFQSLKESSIKVNTVVVDNCSKDETVTYLENNYPNVYIIKNKLNKGFGQANNQGIEYAYKQGATHFFLLNQDAWIQKDTIRKLVDVQNQFDIALVSPIHLNGLGDNYDYSYFVKTVVTECNRTYVADMMLDRMKPYYTCFKINAAAWMLSRRCIKKIGGFDPIYFHYGEDGNYCQRLKYHKELCAFVPGAYIHHDRERQGNMAVYNKNLAVMELLFQYTDVNCSPLKPTKEKTKIHCNHLYSFFKYLFHFQFDNLKNLLRGQAEFLSKLPRISKSIYKNRTEGPSWLNLE